jgi:hypothetical protein
MEDFIKLKKDNVLVVGIKDSEGNDTNCRLKFDLEDVELPLRYQELLEEHKKNLNYVRNQFIIINKKEDRKGKKLLSYNEEEKIRIINDFYKKEIKTMNMFLGDGKVEEILKIMDRKPYISMFDDIAVPLEPLLPSLKNNMSYIEGKIKQKYSNMKEENVIKDE